MRERTGYQPIDPDKIFSWRRFEDGFKKGAEQAFQAYIIGGSVITTLALITNQLEANPKMFAGAIITFLAVEGMYSNTIGALNSFRPTSKLFRSPIEANLFNDIRRLYTYLYTLNI